MNKKWWLVGLLLLITGMVFLLIEKLCYQYLDSANVLQESLFLPLGIFCLFGGILVYAYWLFKRFFYLLNKTTNENHD